MNQELQIVSLEDNLISEVKAHINIDIVSLKESNPLKVVGILTMKTSVDLKAIEKFPNLEFIAVSFTGYDCVDLEACLQKNIKVYNVPDYSSNSVAELTIALAINLLRQIPFAHNYTKSGSWDFPAGQDLKEKTVGILGTGKIGILSAKIFNAFGCKVIGYNRSKKSEFLNYGSYETFENVIKNADILCIHMPSTPETKHLISKNELKLMKKSAYLVNTARSVDQEKDLVEALNNNQIAGAALDVFEKEPVDKDSKLFNTNLILTPHIAYKTTEALTRRAKITAENILGHLQKSHKTK